MFFFSFFIKPYGPNWSYGYLHYGEIKTNDKSNYFKFLDGIFLSIENYILMEELFTIFWNISSR